MCPSKMKNYDPMLEPGAKQWGLLILAEHMFELVRGEDVTPGNDEYYAELKNLTAEGWTRGDYT